MQNQKQTRTYRRGGSSGKGNPLYSISLALRIQEPQDSLRSSSHTRQYRKMDPRTEALSCKRDHRGREHRVRHSFPGRNRICIFSLGGISAGIFSFGGLSVGLLLALGGFSVGTCRSGRTCSRNLRSGRRCLWLLRSRRSSGGSENCCGRSRTGSHPPLEMPRTEISSLTSILRFLRM